LQSEPPHAPLSSSVFLGIPTDAALNIANVIYVVAGGVALAATLIVVILSSRIGREKDRQFEVYKADQLTKTATLNEEIARLNAEGRDAQVKIAEAGAAAKVAEQRAAEARLALAEFAAPRTIDQSSSEQITAALRLYIGHLSSFRFRAAESQLLSWSR